MTKEISFPAVRTWFIAYSGEANAFGCVESNQTMTTGLDTLETFTDEEAWEARMEELHIQPEYRTEEEG